MISTEELFRPNCPSAEGPRRASEIYKNISVISVSDDNQPVA